MSLCALHAVLRGAASIVWRLGRAECGTDPDRLGVILSRVERSTFAAGCVFVLVYLLRRTLTELLPGSVDALAAVAALAVGLLVFWMPARRGELGGLGGLGAALLLLCLLSLGSGLVSIATTETSGPGGLAAADSDLARYDGIRLRGRQNVYFIVPDAYPSRTALEEIYGIDNRGLQETLTSLGFTVYDEVFSNYTHTISSISASFGMRHHFYRGTSATPSSWAGVPSSRATGTRSCTSSEATVTE